jgi:hypothetical protein
VRDRRLGLVYSRLASVALIVGAIVAGLSCALAVVGCVLSLLAGEWWDALVRGPIGALLLLAMFVVFIRTLDAE